MDASVCSFGSVWFVQHCLRHERHQGFERGKMRRLSRHHMLHTPRQAPLCHLGLGVHLHDKSALRGQRVGRLCLECHKHLASCYSGLRTITAVEYRLGRVGKS